MYNLYELLVYQNRIRPMSSFLILGTDVYTYGDVFNSVDKLSSLFLEKDVKSGERVAVVCDSITDYVVAIFACWKNDNCIVPIESSFDAEERSLYLNISKSHRIITKLQGEKKFKLNTLNEFNDPDWQGNNIDVPAELLFTSGSSGIPKAVMLSHTTLVGAAIESCDSVKLRAEDVLFTTVPFWHAYGQNRGLLSTIYAGASVILAMEDDFSSRIDLLKKSKPSVVVSMPNFYGLLCYMKDALSESVRVCLSGAAALAPSIQKKFEESHGIPLLVTFGLTECQLFTCQRIDAARPMGSVGQPIRGVKIKIVDDQKKELALGEPGTILVKGHNVMLGYFGGVDKSISEDGWLDTEDIGKLDESGSLYILGRNSQFIKRSGYKVYPIEIQNFLLEHSDVVDAGVCKNSSLLGGEDLAVFIVLRGGSIETSETILQHCKDKLPAYKTPLECKVVDEIKRLPSGKPDLKGMMIKETAVV